VPGVVILSVREQEYLLRAIEAGQDVRDLRRFFLWTQGQFQALLPHRVLVGLHYNPQQQLVRSECLHGEPLAPPVARLLADMAHKWRTDMAAGMASGIAADVAADLAGSTVLRQCRLDNALLRGTPPLDGPTSFFVLFGMPQQPGARAAYFLQLMLPYLHLALLGLPAQAAVAAVVSPANAASPASAAGRDGHAVLPRALSRREVEVLAWLREGRSNGQIAQQLGISPATVKNHLQRLYRVLAVNNRTEAAARCAALGRPG
jgi:transcriptional regulator EpsA